MNGNDAQPIENRTEIEIEKGKEEKEGKEETKGVIIGASAKSTPTQSVVK